MQRKEDWFESWFDSPYYHLLYQHRDDLEAKEFIHRLMQFLPIAAHARILDLACGKGRHAKYLHDLGYETTGLDLSKESIKIAQEFASEKLKFVVGDMRSFDLLEQFDAICNLFTSFGYFNDQAYNIRVLKQISLHLKPQGHLVIDYLNPNHASISESAVIKQTIEGIQFETQKFIENQCVCKRIDVLDGNEMHHFLERVQLLDLNWFKKHLLESGFEIQNTFGNYFLQPYDENSSQRMILIAKKNT